MVLNIGSSLVQIHNPQEDHEPKNQELKGINPLFLKDDSLEHQMFTKRKLPEMYSGLYDVACQSKDERINAAIPIAQLTSGYGGGG